MKVTNNSTLFIFLFIAAVVSSCGADSSVLGAREWKVVLRVLGDDGKPVSGARAWVAYGSPREGQSSDPFASNDWAKAGMTTEAGLFAARNENVKSVSLGIHVRMEGFYPSDVVNDLGTSYDASTWNISPTLVLKRILKPIPMFAKRLRDGPPVADKAAGYDLEAGDWVAPYGKGIKSDFVFSAHHEKYSADDWDYNLVVSFSNPGDGIQAFKVSEAEMPSALRSPHEAPEQGYEPKWVKTRRQTPGQALDPILDSRMNFFFRVRTVLDDNGNIVSANYGKIYGDFMEFRYYYNPQANSRNIEFDPGKNLMKKLGPSEHVREP